jgi:hypothetical protein
MPPKEPLSFQNISMKGNKGNKGHIPLKISFCLKKHDISGSCLCIRYQAKA